MIINNDNKIIIKVMILETVSKTTLVGPFITQQNLLGVTGLLLKGINDKT